MVSLFGLPGLEKLWRSLHCRSLWIDGKVSMRVSEKGTRPCKLSILQRKSMTHMWHALDFGVSHSFQRNPHESQTLGSGYQVATSKNEGKG